MTYRDIPSPTYNKITYLEMAEHVGVRHFSSYLRQVYTQTRRLWVVHYPAFCWLRKSWQYEDLMWACS